MFECSSPVGGAIWEELVGGLVGGGASLGLGLRFQKTQDSGQFS